MTVESGEEGSDNEASQPTTTSSQKKKQGDKTLVSSSSARARRKRDELRSKSTGVGLKIINATESLVNKKIVFDDDNNMDQVEQVALQGGDLGMIESKPNDEHAVDDDSNDDDDDDDDAVEEVKGSVAKAQAEEQRSLERSNARESNVLKTIKRKRKNRSDKKIDDVDPEKEGLDDEFFERLDAEMKEEKKKSKKQPVESTAPVSRHTTFVVKTDASDATTPIKAGHNIEVVVLKDNPASDTMSLPTTKATLLYSRTQLTDGSDVVSDKQLRKAKKSGRNAEFYTSSWKRSKKMNLLLLPGARDKRRNKNGEAMLQTL